jgi:hypothetical protein
MSKILLTHSEETIIEEKRHARTQSCPGLLTSNRLVACFLYLFLLALIYWLYVSCDRFFLVNVHVNQQSMHFPDILRDQLAHH